MRLLPQRRIYGGLIVSIWFDQEQEIACNLDQVTESLRDLGQHFVGTVSNMPGLTTVTLLDQGESHVSIETNEGLMKRTNISNTISGDTVVTEFDEEYKAGSKVTANSHYRNTFTPTAGGVIHHLVISDVEAPGFLGFFYRRFGSSNIGKAVLASYKTNFEQGS
jgi:hypothetical protein